MKKELFGWVAADAMESKIDDIMKEAWWIVLDDRATAVEVAQTENVVRLKITVELDKAPGELE